MKLKYLVLGFFAFCSSIFGTQFTVSSYNTGCLKDHYDYIRSACMQKLIQERYNLEPEEMAHYENIEKLALKILFTEDPEEEKEAINQWNANDYDTLFEKLVKNPKKQGSVNKKWEEMSLNMITPYDERPIVLKDPEVSTMLSNQVKDLTHKKRVDNDSIKMTRQILGKRALQENLKYDIIALQEGDYLKNSMLSKDYAVIFADTDQSLNGFAWRKDKFELVKELGTLDSSGFVMEFKDLKTQEHIAIATGHLTGCNPFEVEVDPVTNQPDSYRGDQQLKKLIQLLEDSKADVKVLAMDSNVTATHPRLKILKEAGFKLDYTKYLEPTCANPSMVINTRIDWIAVKGKNASVNNIPVLNVGLNSIKTNMSDHKPIAADVSNEN